MTLSVSEIENLRFHLGYGNIGVGAYPYTPDGFYELFNDVVSPNLTTGNETSSTTAVTAGTTATITVVSATGIAVHTRLVIDTGDQAETVVVKAILGTSVTAYFGTAHAVTGYPVCVESGVTRLRTLLHSADKAWATLQSASVTSSAGIKQVDRGAIEWFPDGSVFSQTLGHYKGIVAQIARLVRVMPVGMGRVTQLEAY
jgi:hypothetical protein